VQVQDIVRQLLERQPSLRPVKPHDPRLDEQIAALSVEAFTPGGGEAKLNGLALKAGLHLFNDSLDASHAISQGIETDLGSYWHGIMHRMEGDYGNANYWFYHAGEHPIHSELLAEVHRLLSQEELSASLTHRGLRSKIEAIRYSGRWNPALFTDIVQLQVNELHDPEVERTVKRMQYIEMKLLLQFSYMHSCGGTLLEAK
jgi:hypothetical protein